MKHIWHFDPLFTPFTAITDHPTKNLPNTYKSYPNLIFNIRTAFRNEKKNKTHEILLVWINFQCSIKKSKGSWRIMVIVSVRQWRLSDRAGSTVSSHHDRWGKTFDNKNIIHTCLSYLLFTNSYYRKTNHKQCSRNNHSKTQRLVAKFFGKRLDWYF